MSNEFAYNQAKILSIVDCASQDGLRDNGDLLSQKLLKIRVKVRAARSTRQQKNDDLNVCSYLLDQLLAPNLKIRPLNRKHGHRLRLIVKLQKDFLEHLNESLGLLMIFALIEDTPLLDDWLIKKLVFV